MKFQSSILSALFLLPAALFGQDTGSVKALLQSHKIPGVSNVPSEQVVLSRMVSNTSLGVHHYYLQQVVHEIPVRHAVASVHTNVDGGLVYHNSNFISEAATRTNVQMAVLHPGDAFQHAADALEFGVEAFGQAPSFAQKDGGKWLMQDERYSTSDVEASLIYLSVDGALVLHWKFLWDFPVGSHLYNVFVDAVTGKVGEIEDLTVHCEIDHPHHDDAETLLHAGKFNPFAQDKAESAASGARYYALPVPFESPNHGSFSLLDDPSDSLSSPFGWHDVNGADGAEYTITRGNNVHASEDKAARNIPGYSPDGGSDLVFNPPFINEKRDGLYEDAAIVNLFYMNNVMHDVWYHYGFDEESGNFQQNNYGRGGTAARAGDYVRADARDGSGTNNANFSTPPDGTGGRMQMFLWTSGANNQYLHLTEPEGIAGSYAAARAGFGPRPDLNPIKGNLVMVNDASVNPTQGCQTLQNGAQISGNIAVVARGGCNFSVKVQNAQNAGAVGVIVVNNVADAPIDMGGTSTTINIPSLHISQADGASIINAMLSETVKGAIYDSFGLSQSNVFDSDFDNGIIAHEYGHGISNRLTGGPVNTSCLGNQEQAGEGWSDFITLAMTHRTGDGPNTPRGIGTYVRNQATNGRGIRPYPYTRNIQTNPVTYNSIKTLSVPHGVGFVWCSMLWDLYWNLIDEYGFDPDLYKGNGGNNICMQLVIDGLKLQPCRPGFTDSRDAILKADELRYKGKHQMIIWETFARRGLGYGAFQGSTDSRSDGVTAFDLPPFLDNALLFTKNGPDQMIKNEVYNYEFTCKNISGKTRYNIVLTDTLHPDLEVVTEAVTPNTRIDQNVVTITYDSIEHGDTLVLTLPVRIKLNSKSSNLFFEDDVESETHGWMLDGVSGANQWSRDTQMAYSGVYSWYAPNLPSRSDLGMMHSFKADGDRPALVFRHWFDTEELWDGGVIEIREKGLSVWNDLANLFILNGYNSQIEQNQASAISERRAFTGKSNEWLSSVIDLTLYKGKEVEIRFRMVSDASVGGIGWYVDDVLLLDLAYLSNRAYLTGLGLLQSESNDVITVILEGGPLNTQQSVTKAIVLQVYPNPTGKLLHVKRNDNNPASYRLLDLPGRTVLNGDFSADLQTIDLSMLSSGQYFLEVFSASGREVFKVLKH